MKCGASAYANGKCKCDICRSANTARLLQRVQERTALMDAGIATDWVQHGTASTYTNWGCRCEPCKKAKSEQFKAYLLANPRHRKAKTEKDRY